MGRGKPQPEEREQFAETEVDGITIFYPESIQAEDEAKGLMVALNKILFFKSLELKGVKLDMCNE